MRAAAVWLGRHIELSTVTTGEKLTYHTADDLAVCCDNGLSLASKVAKRLNLSLDAVFALAASVRG